MNAKVGGQRQLTRTGWEYPVPARLGRRRGASEALLDAERASFIELHWLCLPPHTATLVPFYTDQRRRGACNE